jgi:AmmeMemoRadiSam system protein A
MLNDAQRKTLLTIARQSIESMLAGRRAAVTESEADDVLRRPAGVFVTLRTHDGELRGCIGSIVPREPLVRAVTSSAINAAFRDPRFHPVTAPEMTALELEISVMGPIERVYDVSDIVPGRDGLIISRGGNAGLLLPQVATEYGWDREMFLDQTCLKAGLPAGSWRRPETKIEKFSAEVFGE